MSHERTEVGLVFSCDGCDELVIFHAGDFLVAKAALAEHKWTSLKQPGRPWEDYCPHCKHDAEMRHAEHKINEERRERMKARNALK